jgi:toxin ParE1/3/4
VSCYRLAAAAEDDLREIWGHIAADHPAAADRVLADLYRCFHLLGSFALLGKARPDLLPNLRFIPVGAYLVFYIPAGPCIEVMRIIHGARDYRSTYFTD